MNKFNIGDKVKITNGSFENMSGTIEGIDGCDADVENGLFYEYLVRLENTEKLFPVMILESNLEKIESNIFEQSLMDFQSSLEDDEAFFEMAGRIPGEVKIPGKPKDPGLIIAVGSDENKGEAHFHVFRNKIDWKQWKNGACLLFKDNKYFDHGNNRETLEEDELTAVIECLNNKPEPDLPGNNNWQYLIYLWNGNNYNWKIDITTPIQKYDYETITRYKK